MSEIILGPMTRVAYVTTANTGDVLTVRGPEGLLKCKREDPHGVVMTLNGQTLSINKELLAVIGRYFLAAGILLGEDVNLNWDAEGQHAAS
jgi:hypothetical protein